MSLTMDAPATPTRLRAAYVLRSHGLGGELRVEPLGGDAARFAPGLRLTSEDGAQTYTVCSARAVPPGEVLLRVEEVTIFPEAFPGPLGIGVVGRALDGGALGVRPRDLRDWTTDRHRQVDDVPFGGGAGMVLKPEPLIRAVRDIRGEDPGARAILLGPQGRLPTQG